MNMGSSRPETGSVSEAGQTKACGCRVRKCALRTLVGLLVLIVVGGAAVYWALFSRIYNLDVYRSAMRTIAANAEVQEALGQPVRAAAWPAPSARLEESETEIRWPLEGPKGRAKAHLKSRLMSGKWQTVLLEVVLPDDRKIAVRDESEGNDAARWIPPSPSDAKQPDAKQPDATAPEINLAIPDEK